MINQIYTHSSLRNFTYILEYTDVDGKPTLLCIDPFSEELVEDFIDSHPGQLKAVINTHEHLDHIGGNKGLVDKFNCEIWAHENAKDKIPNVTRFLNSGELIELGRGLKEDHSHYQMKVMNTPGHTFAHLCLLILKDKKPWAILTGDTLFNAGVGNCHGGGDPEVLFKTISEQFQNLPDDVLVYPGHDYWKNNLAFTIDREPSNKMAPEMLKEMDLEPNESNTQDKYFLVSTMGLEKEVNTFLRLDREEIEKNLNKGKLTQKEIFLSLRELRNNW